MILFQMIIIIKIIKVLKSNIKMGNIFKKFFGNTKVIRRNCKILMLGLDAAGKTTILYSLKLGKITNTIPTIGFNV